MWFFCFLTCCLTARQDRGGGHDKEIKRRVKKYNLDELKTELEALGVNIDKNDDKQKRKVKKTKRKLQRLLVRELMKDSLNAQGPTKHGDGLCFPMDIPKDIADILRDLDAMLDKELEELEKTEEIKDNAKPVLKNLLAAVDFTLASESDSIEPQVNQNITAEVKAVLHDIVDQVDSTLNVEPSAGERGAGESVVALVDQKQAGGYGGAGGPVLLRLPGPPRRRFYSVPMRRFCFTPIRRFWTIPRRWYQWADGISGI